MSVISRSSCEGTRPHDHILEDLCCPSEHGESVGFQKVLKFSLGFRTLKVTEPKDTPTPVSPQGEGSFTVLQRTPWSC
jgi:hypothetical protein